MCEKDFQTNENGWYTYKGKVVLAAATNACLKSKYGGCGKYNTKLKYIRYYNYYDTLTFTHNGKTYEGIVLDSCGTCMNNHIIDVFVSGSQYSASGRIYIK